MSRPLSLALAQVAPATGLAAFAAHLQRAVRHAPNTTLFVYPEFHLTTPDGDAEATPEYIGDVAEAIDGPRHLALAELAGDLGVWLIPGSFYERGDDGAVYNTTAAYSPGGRRVATYRKIFPWRPAETVASGNEFVTFDIPSTGRIGLSICYDTWFPESSRHLAWMGADAIINMAATDTADRDTETAIARANAAVNQVFFASVNAAGPVGHGRSVVADPSGRVRTASTSNETIILTDVIDLDDVDNARNLGTAAVTRPWAFLDGSQPAVDLPLYRGSMRPETWSVGGSRENAEATR